MKLLYPILLAGLLAAGCDRVKHAASTTLRKTSETVGKSATVVADGLATGAQQAAAQVIVSQALQLRGLQATKTTWERRDSAGVARAQLNMYVVFNQAFADTIQVKLLTREGVEYGRSKVLLLSVREDARIVAVPFDARTDFELGTRVQME